MNWFTVGIRTGIMARGLGWVTTKLIYVCTLFARLGGPTRRAGQSLNVCPNVCTSFVWILLYPPKYPAYHWLRIACKFSICDYVDFVLWLSAVPVIYVVCTRVAFRVKPKSGMCLVIRHNRPGKRFTVPPTTRRVGTWIVWRWQWPDRL